MENCVIKNSKRPYHSTMGPLLDDFTSLSKRRKKLFDNINTQIDTLIKLLQDTDEKLNTHNPNHVNGSDHLEFNSPSEEPSLNHGSLKPESLHGLGLKYESSDTGNETSSTDFNTEPSICNCSRQTLRDLASSVKSFDMYRKISKSLKEFNAHFNDIGKSLLGPRTHDNREMLSPVKLDEKLVCRMIGMHLLHYGLFDVYEQLREESIKLWGENHGGTIGEVMVIAYRTLHDLISKIRSCDIDPVIEWTKLQHDTSNLHVQRFNEIMINLYKIRFLSVMFARAPGADFNSQLVSEVKTSGITSLWKIHNDEIGKLVTQVILGENVPTEAEFEDLKNRTIKMFAKLFCDTGILIKKPLNYDRKPLLSEPQPDGLVFNNVSKADHEMSEIDESCSFLAPENMVTLAFSYRPVLNDTSGNGSTPENAKYKSWLMALTMEGEVAPTLNMPEDKGVPLHRDWLNFRPDGKEKPRQPRMAYRYLNSNSLEHGRRLNFIKNRLNSTGNVDQTLSMSKSLLITTMCDPETICRQNLAISDNMINNIPYYMQNQLYEDEMSSLSRYTDPEDWTSSRNDRTTTVLIATGSEESDDSLLGLSNMGRLIDNYSSSLSSEETQNRTQPTFSLTVFAGPSIFRDSRLSSQLLEADIISQRLLNVSPGSRIRIRFPTRSEEVLENPPRRDAAISSYEHSPEGASPSDEDEQSTTIERSSITLRDILRMIMRGLRAETQPAVFRFRGSRSQHNLEDSRASSQESESPKDKGGTHKRLVRPKPTLKIDQYVDSEYIKVHLPYESPLSVVTCAGHVTFPYLIDVLKVLFKERCEVSSKVGMWLKSNQQLPVESDLGPAFHFHSYLTCAVSKDQTSSENLPIMLSCGHVICKVCHDRLSGKRRKRQFKCPMCPTIVEPNQTMELYLDWNCSHNHCVY